MAAQKVELEVSAPDAAARMRADPRRVAQILDHLLDNAGRSTQAGGKVTLSVETAQGETMTQMAMPVQMSGHRFEVQRPAPLQGQHTRELLTAAGLDAAEIDVLCQRKVVG